VPSADCDHAIRDALRHGRALLKFISANDAGATGSHQCGFYLPIALWQLYTPQPPVDAINHKHIVNISWPDNRVTESAVTWYGKGTRHEYRLTRFGRDFPYLNSEVVGSLLVLIPITAQVFSAFVLHEDDDILEVQTTLGIEVHDTWGIYGHNEEQSETEDECFSRYFREFCASADEFPTVAEFSNTTREALLTCIDAYRSMPEDARLTRAIETEYSLFRRFERAFCAPQIEQPFNTIDEFLKTAASIMNRRKARAGRSFENHVEFLLKDEGIPFEAQPAIDGRPDIVIPSAAAYHNSSIPEEAVFVVGLKTTCKDRWRQVLNEGTRVKRKHLITLQRGISANQLAEMHQAGVSLIVPKPFHRDYPRDSPMHLHTVGTFVEEVRRTLA
jgi:hypothetical protein